MSAGRNPRILFVCLGNICRSPLAEAVMRDRAERAGIGIEVDSAGTGDWHIGEPPDPRAILIAAQHGLDIRNMRARQVRADDFAAFDHVVALDAKNLHELGAIAPPGSAERLSLLLDHAPGRHGEDVADPYFGDEGGFERAWRDVEQGVEGLLRRLHPLSSE